MSTALLTRMSSLGHGGNAPSELQSVLAHLSLLLNTRRGSSPADEGFGMADLTDVLRDFPAGIATLQRMIAEAIQRYEPRLKNVSVRPLGPSTAQLCVSFEVRAQLRGTRVQLQTKLSPNGLVSVT